MDIHEVSKCTGLPASAIRFYEEKGLIRSVGRKGLRRLFSQNILQRLALIALAGNAGFTLAEIKAMGVPHGTTIDRTLLLRKAEELDRKIKTMTTMRDGLRHAAACKARNHFECPKFLRLLSISVQSRRTQKTRSGATKTTATR